LLTQKRKDVQAVLFKKMTDLNIEEIAFTIDSGLIDRLGRELVGKAETAVIVTFKLNYVKCVLEDCSSI